MLRIGITGARGFLGWHLRAFLHSRPEIDVTLADRSTFADPLQLRRFVTSVDAIAHIAGVNRASDQEICDGNVEPARKLAQACQDAGVTPHVLFANSVQRERDTAYGQAKRAAAECLATWSRAHGARFTDMVLPHVFGECGRPFYNSAVATFCHQVAHGETPKIIVDSQLELIHAQRVAERMLAAFQNGEDGELRMPGSAIGVSAVLERIRDFADHYARDVIPPFGSNFELDLFNTYRSYLFPQHYPVFMEKRADKRGELFEAVKTLHGGQCFVSSTRPGVTRGNHYHRHKLERFLVVKGEALIRVRRLLTDQVAEFRVSGDQPGYIDMPALHTHNITNTGSDELLTLFWAHEIFDPAAPDTYAEAV